MTRMNGPTFQHRRYLAFDLVILKVCVAIRVYIDNQDSFKCDLVVHFSIIR